MAPWNGPKKRSVKKGARDRKSWLYGNGVRDGIYRVRSAVGRVYDMLDGVEVFTETRDSSPDVALQLTAAETGETHHLQVPDDRVRRHLHIHQIKSIKCGFNTGSQTATLRKIKVGLHNPYLT